MSSIDLTELTVDEILTRWPQTAQVFRHYRLACVGCAIGSYCNMNTVADIYNVSLQQFLDDLNAVILEDSSEDKN
jgi:hybrid cluster-associated redox disulfide protein